MDDLHRQATCNPLLAIWFISQAIYQIFRNLVIYARHSVRSIWHNRLPHAWIILRRAGYSSLDLTTNFASPAAENHGFGYWSARRPMTVCQHGTFTNLEKRHRKIDGQDGRGQPREARPTGRVVECLGGGISLIGRSGLAAGPDFMPRDGRSWCQSPSRLIEFLVVRALPGTFALVSDTSFTRLRNFVSSTASAFDT